MSTIETIIFVGGNINAVNMVLRGPRRIPMISGIIMYAAVVMHMFGWL